MTAPFFYKIKYILKKTPKIKNLLNSGIKYVFTICLQNFFFTYLLYISDLLVFYLKSKEYDIKVKIMLYHISNIL